MGTEEFLFTLLGAMLYALLYRGRDITTLVKSKSQRNAQEQDAVERGLLRGLLVEFLLLIPISSFLFFIILPLLFNLAKFGDSVQSALIGDAKLRLAFYVLAGMVSYNFPFVLVREMATRIALNTLRESLDLQKPKQVEPAPQPRQIEGSGR